MFISNKIIFKMVISKTMVESGAEPFGPLLRVDVHRLVLDALGSKD